MLGLQITIHIPQDQTFCSNPVKDTLAKSLSFFIAIASLLTS